MSRAGGKAAKERRRVDAWFRKLDEHARADAMIAACERCGLEQVQPPSRSNEGDELPPAGTICVLCGCETARYARAV